jgi:ABC-type nitrate/sulfonate/bicarbonate transport system permease component
LTAKYDTDTIRDDTDTIRLWMAQDGEEARSVRSDNFTSPPTAQAERRTHRLSRLQDRGWSAFSGIANYLRTMFVFAIVWHISAYWVANPLLLPYPLDVLRSFGTLLASGEMMTHVIVSAQRLAASFILACVFGIPLGVAMGLNRLVFDMLDPVIELLRPISGIAWIPIGLFIFGVGDTLPTAIMFYGAFFPIVINTIVSVRSVDQNYVSAARTLGANQLTILRHVILPAALPGILVGARLGAGAGWMSMVAAELIGAPSGLGFAVEWYRELLMTSNVLAFVVVIGLLGYLFDRVLRLIQGHSTAWAQPRFVS